MNKKFIKILSFLIFTICVSLVSSQQIFAQETSIYNPALKELSNTSGTTFLQNILQLGIRLGFVTGAIIFFFMLISGGIKWISSAGDKTRLEEAQKQITHALIGLAILFSVFAIIRLLNYVFGIDLLQISLPTL